MKKPKHHGLVTASGRELNVIDPDPASIVLSDVANGLSREIRFSGLTKGGIYNVAHHSVVVAAIVQDLLPKRTDEVINAALLHDAPEAYLGDIIAPLKAFLPDYRAIEDTWTEIIFRRFGIAPKLAHSHPVKWADHAAFTVEVYFLITHIERYGFEKKRLAKLVQPILDLCPMARSIERPWTRDEAEARFFATATARLDKDV